MAEWTRWPIDDTFAGKFFVNSLALTENGLRIELSDWDNVKKVEIIFDGLIDAYRYTNDSFSFKTPSALSEKYGPDFYKKWSFFMVKNSEYLQWLSDQSLTYCNEFSFIHFCIVGGDEIVDILSRYEPTIKIIENKKEKQ